MPKPPTSTDPKETTPRKWTGPEDARTYKGAGVYPNYYTKRTRSGHVFTLDDSEDNESITLQHRGGSMVQFMPDGAVQFVAQNGQYTFVFGENRVEIHGAYDVTVHGSGSMRVDKDFDVTVMGNHNMTVNGDFNLQAKNFNGQIRGNMDFNAKNLTTKVEGSTEISSHGITSIGGDGGVAVASTSAGVGLKAAADIAIKAGGVGYIETGGTTNIKAGGDIAMDASPNIELNSGKARPATLTLDAGSDPNSGSSAVA